MKKCYLSKALLKMAGVGDASPTSPPPPGSATAHDQKPNALLRRHTESTFSSTILTVTRKQESNAKQIDFFA